MWSQNIQDLLFLREKKKAKALIVYKEKKKKHWCFLLRNFIEGNVSQRAFLQNFSDFSSV